MKEHHIAIYVIVPSAGGSWTLACIIQTVMSTKTQQAAVWQQSHAGNRPAGTLHSVSDALNQPSFLLLEYFFPCQQEIDDEGWKKSRLVANKIHKSPTIPFTNYQLLLSTYTGMELTTRKSMHIPMFHTASKNAFSFMKNSMHK